MPLEQLKDKINALPEKAGVYMFKSPSGKVLYVGKAQNIKKRVRQYSDPARLDPAKRELVKKVTAVEPVVVRNEAEAFVLEAQFISRFQPPYNIRLLNEDSYLYIKITDKSYPKISLTRKMLADGSWYRGPYPSAKAVRQSLRVARQYFPWCAYSDPGKKHSRSCFAYHLGLCPGICVNEISLEEYQKNIEGLKSFLDGDAGEVIKSLKQKMKELSSAQKYEKAARIRDKLRAVEKTMTPQYAVVPSPETADIIGLAKQGDRAVVNLLQLRRGRIIGSQFFSLLLPHTAKDKNSAADENIYHRFFTQYYQKSTDIPPAIIVPRDYADLSGTKNWLKQIRGKEVRVTTAQRGWKNKMLELASLNAREHISRSKTELESAANIKKALKELADNLNIEISLSRIEAYDISNIQGTLATASMVVFQDGKPLTSAYRKFKIISKETPDDVGMMKEALMRRFTNHAKKRGSDKEWPLPNLILLDGGKGQLKAGLDVMNQLKLRIPVAALAKREEELFKVDPETGKIKSILLPRTSPALYLVQRIRDEAHRFTLGYHQLLRKKRLTRSILEEIPGVGPKTRKKLLRDFGSLKGIKNASLEELKKSLGSENKAKLIKKFLAEK